MVKTASVVISENGVESGVLNADDTITVQEKPDDMVVDDLFVQFSNLTDGDIVPDSDGRILVSMSGICEFYVHQSVDEDGNVVFASSLFKSTQDDMQSALKLSVANAARRAFRIAYDAIYPPEVKERKPRESIKAKFEEASAERDVAKAQLDVIRTAASAGLMPTADDFTDAGLPVPEWIS